MLILGEKEAKNDTVSLRQHQKGDIGSFAIEKVVNQLKKEIKESQATFKV
jgi:threonyl-tRNA synthetase